MKNKKEIYNIFLVCILFFGVPANPACQQTPIFSQNVMTGFMSNPAMTGYEGITSLHLMAHEQWIGFAGEESPKTHIIGFQTRILKKEWIPSYKSLLYNNNESNQLGKTGMGGYIFLDKNGHHNLTGLQYAYSYHVNLQKGFQLSLGLAATFLQLTIDEQKLNARNPVDKVLMNNRRGIYIFDPDFGIFLDHPKFYTGLSIQKLSESWIKHQNQSTNSYKMLREYQLTGGYLHSLKNNITLEPSVLLKTNEQWNMLLEASVKIFHEKGFWAGVTYRTRNAFVCFGGLKINKLFIGYAFDYGFNSLQTYTFGTHELSMTLKLGDPSRKFKHWSNF